jgi:hypothetical protein
MNEIDTVLHTSFEEASKYYDDVTGVFEECKDDETGQEHDIETYKVFVNEPGDEPQRMTVEKGIEANLIDFPCIFTTEGDYY